mmetsp:Transcript_17418/g.43122  ORF Transcript_17418/g.43122 Transcript_17418/m.43122 type:complete len:260 (-) Transcript_17418:603-1382(-)
MSVAERVSISGVLALIGLHIFGAVVYMHRAGRASDPLTPRPASRPNTLCGGRGGKGYRPEGVRVMRRMALAWGCGLRGAAAFVDGEPRDSFDDVVKGVPVNHGPTSWTITDDVFEPRGPHEGVARESGGGAQLRAVHWVGGSECDVQQPLRTRLVVRIGVRVQTAAAAGDNAAVVEHVVQWRFAHHGGRDCVDPRDGGRLHALHILLSHVPLPLLRNVASQERDANAGVVQRVAPQVPHAHQQRGHAVAPRHHRARAPH